MTKRAATVPGNPYNASTPVRGDKMLDSVFRKLCVSSSTPFANAAWHRWREGNYIDLLKMQVDPFFYTWSGRYAELELDLQIVSLVKCYQDFKIPGVDREKLAYEKWLRAEESCRETNQMFRSRWTGSSKPLSHPVEEVYHLVKRKITEIMGTVKPRDLALLRESCHHGPGGDLSLGKRNASPYEKYRSRGAITEPCQGLYDVIFGNEDADYRQDLAHEALIVLESRLSFVPKTALIDRAICIEPRWNVYLQLGIGGLIEKRLKRYGMVLIRDQSRNSEFARRAWADGLATIDLSSASDTVSTNLVLDLLADGDPFWLDLIMKSRCAYVKYRGRTIRLEKVSSMGNGYTFPLESAIFYAFAWAAARVSGCRTQDITVYGDDIIVPRSCSSLLIESLGAFGFTVNTAKSFTSGDFFESCGQDFFRGREVRPVFLKNAVTDLASAMVFHNKLVRWANRGLPPGEYNDDRLALADLVANEIPRPARRYGPSTIGGVLHGPAEKWVCRKPKERSWEGVEVMSYAREAVTKSRYSYKGHLYSKLSQDLDCRNRVINRHDPEQARDAWILVPNEPPFTQVKGVGLSTCSSW
jgi:hypothetical protein